MELPKNLIQMGKPDRTHKIFVEDYIISYIKEWNRESDGQPAGIALYGQVYKESNYKYYFMYGASRIEGLDRRGPYLSQSDRGGALSGKNCRKPFFWIPAGRPLK